MPKIGFLEGKRPLRRFLLLPWRMAITPPSVVFSGLGSLPEYVLIYSGGEKGVVAALITHDDVRELVIPLLPRGSVVPLELAVKNQDRMPVLKEAVRAYRFGIWLADRTREGAFIAPTGPSTAKFSEAAEAHVRGSSTLVSPIAQAISGTLANKNGGVVAISVRLSEKAVQEIKKLKKKAERRFKGMPFGDPTASLEVQVLMEKLRESNFDVRIVAYGPAARDVLTALQGISALRSMKIASLEWKKGDWSDEEYRLISGVRGKPMRMGSKELALLWPYLDRERGAGYLVRLEVPAAASGTIRQVPNGIHILDVLTDRGELEEVRIPPEEFTMHMMYYAKTGAGKTTLAVNMIAQLAEKGYRVLFIDPNEIAALTLPSVLAKMGMDPEEDIVVFDPRFYPARFNALEAAEYPSLGQHIPHLRDMVVKALNIVEEPVVRNISSWVPYREALLAAIKFAYEINEKPTLVDVWEALQDVINAENEGILSLSPPDLRAQINAIRSKYYGEEPAKRTERAKAELAVVLTRLSEILGHEVVMSSLCALDHSHEGGARPITYNELFSRPRVVAWALPFYLNPDIRDPLIRFLFGSFWLWMLYRSMGGSTNEIVIIALDELHVLVNTYHQQISDIITMARKYGGGLIGFTQDPEQMEGVTKEARYLRKIALSQPNVVMFGQTNVLHGDDIPLSPEERDLVPTLPEYHSLVRYSKMGIVYGGKNPVPAKRDESIAPPQKGDPSEAMEKEGFRRLMQSYAERWGADPRDVHILLERMRRPAHERTSRAYAQPPPREHEAFSIAVIKALTEGTPVYMPTRRSAEDMMEFIRNLLIAGVIESPPRVYVSQARAREFWRDVERMRRSRRSTIRVMPHARVEG